MTATAKAQHDYMAIYRNLQVSHKVMVKNRHPRPTWLPGEIIQKLGPVTYLVNVLDDHPGSVT